MGNRNVMIAAYSGGLAAVAVGTLAGRVDGMGKVVYQQTPGDAQREAEAVEPTLAANRAERRRRAKVAHLMVPDVLDIRKPGWDRRLLDVIDRVYVDGSVITACEAYSKAAGWAKPRGGEKVFGKVTVTRKLA